MKIIKSKNCLNYFNFKDSLRNILSVFELFMFFVDLLDICIIILSN